MYICAYVYIYTYVMMMIASITLKDVV